MCALADSLLKLIGPALTGVPIYFTFIIAGEPFPPLQLQNKATHLSVQPLLWHTSYHEFSVVVVTYSPNRFLSTVRH